MSCNCNTSAFWRCRWRLLWAGDLLLWSARYQYNIVFVRLQTINMKICMMQRCMRVWLLQVCCRASLSHLADLMQFCFMCFSYNSFEETETDTNVSLAVICDTIVSVCISSNLTDAGKAFFLIPLISTGNCLGFIISRWIWVIVDVLIVCGRSIWPYCRTWTRRWTQNNYINVLLTSCLYHNLQMMRTDSPKIKSSEL